MSATTYFYPSTWALPLAALGVVAYLFQYKRLGKGCLLLALTLALIRPVRILLLAFFPAWMATVLGIVALIVATHASLKFIFGRPAVDNMVGQLLAGAVMGLLKMAGGLLRPLWGSLFPGGKAIGAANSLGKWLGELVRPGTANFAQKDATLDLPNPVEGLPEAAPSEYVIAKVIAVGPDACEMALLNGATARLPHKPGVKPPALHQTLRCQIIERLEGGGLVLEKTEEI